MSGCGEDKQWAAFKIAHRCKVVAKAQAQLLSNAALVPATTSYLCDDGVTYMRNED
jgi:hypothetical protein